MPHQQAYNKPRLRPIPFTLGLSLRDIISPSLYSRVFAPEISLQAFHLRFDLGPFTSESLIFIHLLLQLFCSYQTLFSNQ
jgi:hypothetical protein